MSEDSPKILVDEDSDRFPWPDVLPKIRPFFKRKRQDRFPSAVQLNPLRERIVARLSEYLPNLPILSGKLTEGWTDFALKHGILH